MKQFQGALGFKGEKGCGLLWPSHEQELGGRSWGSCTDLGVTQQITDPLSALIALTARNGFV